MNAVIQCVSGFIITTGSIGAHSKFIFADFYVFLFADSLSEFS